MLSNKARALQLYDPYIQDARQTGSLDGMQHPRQLRQEDEQTVEYGREHIEMPVQDGKF